MGHTGTRVTLVVLQAFVAFTTIFGALFVVPTLPLEWIQRGPMTDYTIPAIALGVICGGSALVALLLLALDSEHAGVASMVAGAMMIAFELVEIVVVGLSVIVHGADNLVSWLQIFYIGIGIVTVALGYRLWHLTATPWIARRPAH
jgi:hypothetical protein